MNGRSTKRRRATPFLLLAIATLACLTQGLNRASGREWVDSTGKHKIDATYVKVDGEKVKLKRPDGKIISVPIDRLSAKDQSYIKIKSARQKAESGVSEENRKKADALVDQAVALFKVDPKGNSRMVSDKLKEASKLNPYSIRAEFIRGLLNLMVATSPREALKNFEDCAKRAPENAAVLNNLAVTKIKIKKFREALDHFEKAMEVAPGLPCISHNLGGMMKIHNDKRLVMPRSEADRCADMYSGAVTKNYPPSQPRKGWMLLEFIEVDEDETPSDLPKNIASGGTGFVVKQGYIVTNKHVVGESKTVKLKMPGGKSELLEGSVVAVSDSADIAVVRCPELKMPPVPIASSLPRRGSDIMVLGFPQFSQLGATLKSTRGAITSLPSPQTENMMLLDAEMNSGNSGGPVANKQGHVVAVATAVFKPIGGTGGKYGAGIPIVTQMSFLKSHIPGLATQSTPGQGLSWPDVDERVSKSTVLVLIESQGPDGPEVAGGFGIPFLDPTCPGCNGSKKLKKGFSRAKPCPHCRGTGVDLDVVKAYIERKLERGERP